MSALIVDVDSLAVHAQDIRPGDTIREDDGRLRTVRTVKYPATTVLLVYMAGPSDVFRRTYLLDVVTSD